MTIHEFLTGTQDELEFYSVKELYRELGELMSEGKGNYAVFIPNYDNTYMVDYRLLDKKMRN